MFTTLNLRSLGILTLLLFFVAYLYVQRWAAKSLNLKWTNSYKCTYTIHMHKLNIRMYKYKNTNVPTPTQMFKGEEQKCIVHSLKAHWTNINAQIKIHNNTNIKVVAKSAFSLKDYWTNTRPTVQTDHYPVCIGEKSEAWKSVQVFIWLDVNEWWGLIVGIVLVQSLDFDQITENNIRYRHSIAMTLSF